jgi:hypothetical protein
VHERADERLEPALALGEQGQKQLVVSGGMGRGDGHGRLEWNAPVMANLVLP